MKKLLLIALMVGGLAFVPVQRSEAQVSVGIGFGYPSYGYRYYPSYGYMAITHMDTIDPIGTTAILEAHHITMDTVTTATIGIIATTITKVT